MYNLHVCHHHGWKWALGSAPRKCHARPVMSRARRAVNEVVENRRAAAGIRALTLYAFSADNWGRPEIRRVAALMRLLRRYLMTETGALYRAVDPDQHHRPPRPPECGPGARQSNRVSGSRAAVHRDGICGSPWTIRPSTGIIEGWPGPGWRGSGLSMADRFQELAGPGGSFGGRPQGLWTCSSATGGRRRRLSDFLLWQCCLCGAVLRRLHVA